MPSDAAACWFEDCYYYTLSETAIGEMTYELGPEMYISENVSAMGEYQGAFATTAGSLVGIAAGTGPGMLTSLAIDQLEVNKWAVYQTEVPMQLHEKVVRYVWPNHHHAYRDRTFRYNKVMGAPKRVGEPIRYE